MKINSGTGWALAIGAGGLVLYFLWDKLTAAGKAVANVNKGTPYAGAGPVGTLGNLTNQASGGTLASLGEWIGGGLYSITHSSYDPNAAPSDRATPPGNLATVPNPVKASPSILPYSYKQATIDTPALLGTDQLFTPVPGGGSSGSYSEDDSYSTGTGPLTGYYPDFGLTDPTQWN